MKSLRWNSVIGGIAAVVTLIGVTLFVLLYARSGALHGRTFRLFVAAPDANNLLAGSEVWLNGQRVGVVRNISFNSARAPTDVRVIIETEVLAAVRPLIRLDSRASLRSGGTVIGQPVVYLSSGTRLSRGVVPDDTLRSRGSPDFEIAASRVTESMAEVPTLLADSRAIIANAKIVSGRLTTMAGADGAARASLTRNASALMARVTGGTGSAHRIAGDSDMRLRVSRSMAAMDSLRALLSMRAPELGRFRRDSTLAPTVRALMSDVARLRTMAASTDGTIGRWAADSSIHIGLTNAYTELSALMTDIKSHPLKYSRVF